MSKEETKEEVPKPYVYKKCMKHVTNSIGVIEYAVYDEKNPMHRDYMEDGIFYEIHIYSTQN